MIKGARVLFHFYDSSVITLLLSRGLYVVRACAEERSD